MAEQIEWLKTTSRIARDLGINRQTQLFFAEESYRKMFPYIPSRQMQMSRNVRVTADANNGEILFKSPYSHYQWAGYLWLSPSGSSWARLGEKKHPTETPLNYSKSPHPLATSLFDRVMWKAHGDEITRAVDIYRKKVAR